MDDVPAHEFGRHALSGRLLAPGASLAAVQKLGGWASISVLVRKHVFLEDTHPADHALRGFETLSDNLIAAHKTALPGGLTAATLLISGVK